MPNAVSTTSATSSGTWAAAKRTPNIGSSSNSATSEVPQPLTGHCRLRPRKTQPISLGAAASSARVPWARSQLVDTTTVMASMTHVATELPRTR